MIITIEANKKIQKKKISLNDISINSKMVGFTLIILTLVGLIAGYGLLEINTLAGQIHTIHNENWPLVDDVMGIRIDLNAQTTDLHAYLLGESDSKAEFLNLDTEIQSLFANISKITGSNQNLDSAKSYYTDFKTLATESGTGLFDSADTYFANNDKITNDYQTFLSLHDTIESLIIDAEAQAAPETGHYNATVSDDLLTLDTIFWETENLVSQAVAEANNTNVQSLQSQFFDTYQGRGSDSIVNQLNSIQNDVANAILDNSIGTLASTYFNQAKSLISISNSTFSSWSSYGIDTINGIFATKI